jgi:hypothetical protein
MKQCGEKILTSNPSVFIVSIIRLTALLELGMDDVTCKPPFPFPSNHPSFHMPSLVPSPHTSHARH